MKKSLSFILILTLVFSLLSGAAFADDATMNVTLCIEGIEENLYFAQIEVPADETLTILDFLALIDDEDLPEIVFEGEGEAAYIVSIAEEEAATFGGFDGWMYLVNGEAPEVSIGAYELADGDSIVFYYSDAFGVGMQYPVIDFSTTVTDGVITFTSLDTTYDEEGAATTTENPVAGMTVLWGEKEYTTDENGVITVEDFEAEVEYAFAFSRYDESGVPTVLRSVPGMTVTLEAAEVEEDPQEEEDLLFSDVAADAAYADAVAFLFDAEIMNGVGSGRFAPDETLTRAMTVTILWRTVDKPDAEAAADFTDVLADTWYTDAVAWASESGVVLGYGNGLFGTNDPVTLEQLATIVARYILEETVSLEEGLVWATDGGFFDDMGIEDYTANATRAQVAQFMYNIITSALETEADAEVAA